MAARLAGRVPLIHDLGFERNEAVTTALLDELGYAVAVCPLGLMNAMSGAAGRAMADLAPPPRKVGPLGAMKP